MNPLMWLNPGRWLLYTALFGALVLGAWALERHIEGLGYAKAVREYEAQAKAVDAKRAAISPAIAAKQEAAQLQIRTVTKTILKEIPVYANTNDCPGGLSAKFRSLHDAAALADVGISNATGIADAASVPTADVAETVVTNYGACHETASRLSGLQDWVRAQAALK